MRTKQVDKIIRNMAECPVCHEVVESTHRHDYRRCSCGNIAVDGGKEYTRRSWGNGGMPIERSEIVKEEIVLPDYVISPSVDNYPDFRNELLEKCDQEPPKKPTKKEPVKKTSVVPRRMSKRSSVRFGSRKNAKTSWPR
jgi:hypothetical protein